MADWLDSVSPRIFADHCMRSADLCPLVIYLLVHIQVESREIHHWCVKYYNL